MGGDGAQVLGAKLSAAGRQTFDDCLAAIVRRHPPSRYA